MVTDRRRMPRYAYRDGVLPPSARVRPGHEVTLVDLSSSGMLAEGSCPLRPGSLVEVRVELEQGRLFIEGEVVRSYVSTIDPRQGIRYRAAIAFTLPIPVKPPGDLFRGYELPAEEPRHVQREDSGCPDASCRPLLVLEDSSQGAA